MVRLKSTSPFIEKRGPLQMISSTRSTSYCVRSFLSSRQKLPCFVGRLPRCGSELRRALLSTTFSSDGGDDPADEDDIAVVNSLSHRRVWKSDSDNDKKSPNLWKQRIIDDPHGGRRAIEALVEQDTRGMRPSHLGVLHQDPATDMKLLIDNYTVKAVASALRDREDALQEAAILAADGRLDELQDFLQIFHPKHVLERRQMRRRGDTGGRSSRDEDGSTSTAVGSMSSGNSDDPVSALHTDASRQVLRKALMRMPRTVTTAHSNRAAVCLALCLSAGVPSLLMEKRAKNLRNHPDEVCLPGGMVCDMQDRTIVSTSIREMREEIGGLDEDKVLIEVLGVLRLNWGEVQHLSGVAVTPVVCYLGELPDDLSPNPDEVSEVFTVPLEELLDESLWVHKEGLAPIFLGGPHVIWGLTGYVLERFGKDILRPLRREKVSV